MSLVMAAPILAATGMNGSKDKCLKCGKCCYYRVVLDDRTILMTEMKCPFLTTGNLCRVYDKRPSWCLTAEEMIAADILPEGCGYRKG